MPEQGFFQALFGAEWTPGAIGIWLFGLTILSSQLLKWMAERREWRSLSIEEQQARREGFTAQVEFLTKQLKEAQARVEVVQAELQTEREAHDEYRRMCHAETEQLRCEIRRLSDDIAALHRREHAFGDALARKAIDPERAPHAAASAERAANARNGNGDHGETT